MRICYESWHQAVQHFHQRNARVADGVDGFCSLPARNAAKCRGHLLLGKAPHHGSPDSWFGSWEVCFQVHGITDDGTGVCNRSIRRRQLLKVFESQPNCLVGIEACGSAQPRKSASGSVNQPLRQMGIPNRFKSVGKRSNPRGSVPRSHEKTALTFLGFDFSMQRERKNSAGSVPPRQDCAATPLRR